ncbi:MAG: hypothetical protein C4575_07315 [Desulforudis sp.]|nr:MAG: hypothetical protein C4575_07315 [Desulforudis sp.]
MKKMKKQEFKQPKEKVRFGKIGLALWENTNRDGKCFNSFSLNKTIVKQDENDKSRFCGQRVSINGLTWADLRNIVQAVSEMELKTVGIDELAESG